MEVECPHLLNESQWSKSLQGKALHKDQCTRCFHSPHDPAGIYLCMKCFNSFCKDHLGQHHSQHRHLIYVNITDTPQQQSQVIEINKLAIGVEGGARHSEPTYTTSYRVYCHSCQTYEPSNHRLLDSQVKSVINTDSPYKKQSLATWELEIHSCEHTLTLQQQLTNPNLMCCSQCGLSTNLWLCLTCGNTGCGRKNWDGTGGNGHGVGHYESTKHPLVVKLGTITAEGQASVYCYSCQNDVKDDGLHSHLSVLGINTKHQQKTEKTIAEISLDLNLNFSLNKLIDKGCTAVFGLSLTGINNIGNTCYMNSVVQLLSSLPETRHVYYEIGLKHLEDGACKNLPASCFYCQTAKVVIGLHSGQYSQKITKKLTVNGEDISEEYQQGITPYDFKLLIAKNHQQFSSSRQQDALEYLQHLFDRLNKEEPFYSKLAPLPSLFDFKTANRLVCTSCQGYKVVQSDCNEWKLPIEPPSTHDLELYYKQLEAIDPETRKSKQCQDPEYDYPFQRCLDALKTGELVSLYCQDCQADREFHSRHYFATTPKYLLTVPNRFVLEKWVPKKLNAMLNAPEQLNLEEFFLSRVPITSKLIDSSPQAKPKTAYTESNVQALAEFGFHKNAAKRAFIATQNNVEAACNWIYDNASLMDLDAPLQEQPPNKPTASSWTAEDIQQIMEMSFDEQQAKIALIKQNSNVQAAIEWLFEVNGDVSQFQHLLNQAVKPSHVQAILEPSHAAYALKAVVVHLGKSVHSGHYVVYIKQGSQWVLYNDDKVYVQDRPVLEKGYLYVYEAK